MPSLRVSVSPLPDRNGATVQQVEISVNSVPAKTVCAVDRELDVVLYIGSFGDSSMAFHAKVEIPAGQFSGTTTIPIVRRDAYCAWTIDVFENGRSIQQGDPVVSSANPQRTTIQLLEYSQSNYADSLISKATDQTNPYANPLNQYQAIPVTKRDPASAFEEWRPYMSYDAVCVPGNSLSELSAKARKALSQYAMAGGTIVVYGSSDVDRLTIDQTFSGGQLMSPDHRWGSLMHNGEKYCLRRSHGGGQIVIDSIEGGSERKLNPGVFAQLLSESRHHPVSTIFYDDDVDYEWFWKNLVESVGTTPIVFFTGLIVLILLIVGPVMILIARRLRRQTLLLFLIPAFSITMSVFVLIVNVFIEGRGTTGRVASLQYYDTDSKQGFVWSRQSYSSGAPPRSGLEFSDKALLSPLRTDAATGYQQEVRSNVQGHLFFENGKQTLKYWMLPRAQQQLIVAHPLEQYSMPIKIEGNEANAVQVTNTSKHPIELVILKDANQNFFVVEGLEAGATVNVNGEALDTLSDRLIQWTSAFTPKAPKEVDSTNRPRGRVRIWGGSGTVAHEDFLGPVLNIRTTLPRLDSYGYFMVSRHELVAETPFPSEVFAKEKNLHILTGVSKW
ncbi:MAG: hypothetical protein ACK57V_02495 [Pirellula sp.]|jgi:hypothetical protein